MDYHVSTGFKAITSSTRIMFELLPGLGAMIVLRMAIHLYRPDIEDAEHRVRPVDKLYDCYDFIIVGGGSAGSVLANRLSENPDWTVLLLEAGQDENVLSELPVLFPVLQTSSIDWQFVTEPSDEYCLSMVDKRCKWPRGKVLGGSSVLNAMLYIRGNKRDYDNWESFGNPGWSYEEVLPYFRKSEDMRIPEYQGDFRYHGTGGPLTVEYFNYELPITRKIVEAGLQMGYKLSDVNGEYQTGFTRSHATVRDGLRCSTAKAFLRPAAKRPNLHVSVHSLVLKVLVDENKRAFGVQFTKHGKIQIVKANKEVILSAGAIQSPQLLMLSGIGDAEHLKETGIYPIVNLPGVGQNLQDHIAMGGHSFLFDNPYQNGSDYCFNLHSVFTLDSLIDFSVHKEGLLYSMMEAEAMAFVNTKYQDPEEDFPDIQLFIAPTADNMDGGLFGKRANGLTDEAYAELYEDILYDSSFSVVPLLLRPKSRGFLKLRDSNPFSPPRIYPNYFTHPDDVKIIIEGGRIVQALVDQPALQELNSRPNPNRNPGCARYELMTDEHLECQARHHSLTIYHPVGTCKMGPEEDQQAVVDTRLRVYGIQRLRVVDGSIMPTITSGNTNAPIIMIAEKASDMIKEDWAQMQDNDDPVCEKEYATPYSKSTEHEEETDKPSEYQRPDVFNETSELFPNLPKETIRNLNKVNNDKPKTKDQDSVSNVNNGEMDTKHQNSLLSKEHEAKSKGVLQPEKDVQNTRVNMLSSRIPQMNYDDYYSLLSPYPYLSAPNYLIPPPPPPYPYANSPLVYPGIFTSPNYQPNLNNFGSSYIANRVNPYSKYKTKSRPANSNKLLTKQYFYPYNDPDSLLYETKEEITPKGEKKCKIWLYYDGLKYEVRL